MLIVPLFVVPLHGEHGEDQNEHAEDDPLHQADEELEAVQSERNERERDGSHHSECELSAVDVAEESHRERHWLDELQEELEDADEESDWPPFQREEFAEVAADAECTEALVVEVAEGDEGKADGHIDVACWCAKLMHASNARDQPRPVRNGDEEEAGEEEGDGALCAWPTDTHRKVRQTLDRKLDRVLHTARDLFEASREE